MSPVGASVRAFVRPRLTRARPARARPTGARRTPATLATLVVGAAVPAGTAAAVVTSAVVTGALLTGGAAAASDTGASERARAVATPEAAVPAADETFDVVGHGYGHGRGMSQWGARGAADARASLGRILGFYYPGTRYGVLPGGAGTMRIVLTNAGAEGVAAPGDPRQFQCDAAATDPRENCGFAALPTPGISVRDVLAGTRAQPLPRTVNGKPVRLWGIGVAGVRGLRLYADIGEGGWRPVGPERSGHLEVADPKTGSVQMSHRDATVRDYRGVVRVVRTWGTSATTIARVNLVGLDDYLRGVVPREMPAGWPATALSAQAVTARSYAASRRDAATAVRAPWDLCDSTACQVYGGRGVRFADGRGARLENARTDAAIGATAGRAVLYGGRAAYAQFSAANGGWTARSDVAYQRATPDRWDADGGRNPHTTWRVRVPVAAWQALLPAGSRLTRVVVTQREGTAAEWGGRVLRARLEGTAGGGAAVSREVSGEELRRAWAGVGKLRSSWFRILPAADPHDQLAALATVPGSADLATRGGGGHLLVRPWSAGTGLGAITDLGGVVLGAPAIAGAGASREVFARGGDGKLWWKRRSRAGSAWSGGWVAPPSGPSDY
ncbi:MAG: SpoIID/LytB domain-containing protein [Mycobacterium leprae]